MYLLIGEPFSLQIGVSYYVFADTDDFFKAFCSVVDYKKNSFYIVDAKCRLFLGVGTTCR